MQRAQRRLSEFPRESDSKLIRSPQTPKNWVSTKRSSSLSIPLAEPTPDAELPEASTIKEGHLTLNLGVADMPITLDLQASMGEGIMFNLVISDSNLHN